MYQVRDYLDVNVVGTGVLLELLGDDRRGVRALAVASSRAVYGEGAYRCVACGPVTPRSRTAAQLRAREWEPRCPQCGGPVTAVPTPEGSVPRPASVYAVSKQSQEQTALVVGAARDLPVVALRYFNVYGSRQSLSNPYTGVIPALVRRALSGRPPEVYEDGEESRDFVHVGDVVRATLLAIDDVAAPEATSRARPAREATCSTWAAASGFPSSTWLGPSRPPSTGPSPSSPASSAWATCATPKPT
jgi:dTDP-L-rhamnose 4-epimerase